MKELLLEANKMYNVQKPRCREHCPIDTPIPEAIALFKEAKWLKLVKCYLRIIH